MIISVIGAGILGLACGASLARGGHQVFCADMDEEIINAVKEGDFPGYEQGLGTIVRETQEQGTLSFTSNIKKVIKDTEIILITCEMPEDEDHMPSLRFAKTIAQSIGSHMDDHKVIVLKASVPPGSAVVIEEVIRQSLADRDADIPFDVVVCPAFATPGNLLKDIERPKFIVIGAKNPKAGQKICNMYLETGFVRSKILNALPEEVELANYAIDGLVAVKTAYINELAMLCEKLDIDINETTRIMGKDSRISPQLMDPSPGFGGSVLPKSVRTLVSLAKNADETSAVIDGAILANENQKQKCLRKIETILGDVSDKTIAVLGLSMEHGTDDLREAPSLDIIKNLTEKEAKLRVFDPDGYQQAKWRLFKEKAAITFCESIYEAAEGADAMVVMTRWPNTRATNEKQVLKKMKGKVLIDFQNLFIKRDEVKCLFDYYGLGKGKIIEE